MNMRSLTRLLWLAAVIVAASDIRSFKMPAPSADSEAAPSSPLDIDGWMSPDSASTLATIVADADPFRLDRHPSGVPYRVIQAGSVLVAAAPPVRPTLALVGIVGGPPWAAVLNGIPGRSGPVVLYVGDTLAGLRIRSIKTGSIVVSGMDTVWRLQLQQPWR